MKDFIKFDKVSKIYKSGEKEYVALDNVSFTIKKGEFVVILGPSGAGKSTLLNLLGGMDRATSGSIIVDGDNITNYKEKALTKYRANNVGFIFQFYNILPTLTVLENVDIVKDIVKKPLDSKEILNDVGLIDHIKKFPNELSGGEQQRVSIARAIAKNPKIILADEPTGALDTNTGVEILKLLKKQCIKNRNTVIVVTHNELISKIADRVIKLKNGSIEENTVNKKPKEVTEVKW